MIFDHLGNQIDLECIVDSELLYPLSKQQQRWDRHHIEYVTKVGKIVGFSHPKRKKEKLTRTERKIFSNIFEEYHHQPILREIFDSYDKFLYCFLIKPYGIKTVEEKYVDLLPELSNQLEEVRKEHKRKKPNRKKLEEKINELKNEINTIKFIRGINLPILLNDSLERYERNPFSHQFEKDIEIDYTASDGKIIKTILHPQFSDSLWEDIFSKCQGNELSSDEDCIFITTKLNADKTKDAMFQKYWFASLLHAHHPNIHYLNFVSPSDKVPSPLLRVKLMKAENELNQKTLIVGGLMGSKLDQINTYGHESIEEFIDERIKEYFQITYSNEKFGKRRISLTYNFSHPRKISTSNQFIDYIKLNYAVSNNIFKLAFGATRESSRATFVVKDNPIEIANISCFDSEEPYQGEQYSETFGFNNRNNRVGAFTPLEGRVSGLNIAKKEMDSEKKALARQHSKLARIIKATSKFCASVLLITCLANYTSMKIEHCNNTQEYSFLRMIRNRLPKDQVDYGKEISPQIYEFVDSSKEVIAIDRFIPTKKMRYAYSPERCLEETKHLLDLLCHNGNILNNIVVCENPYRKDFDKKFEERPNPTQTEKLERVSFNLNAIEEVSGVTLGEPKIIPFGIPFLTENDYYRDYRQGIEIKVKGEEKPYLITAKYHGNDNDIKQLLFVMHTYIGFRKQEGNNNDKKIELVVDSKFMDEVTNLSKQFSEYQYHKQLFKLENNSLKYNEIRIDPYLNNGQIDYKITVGKKTCIRWKKTISGVSATWKGVSLTCDRYYARPIFTINTAHLSAIKAGDNDNNKNILYIETRNPLKLKAHQIPHEAAKKLEKLLQPFAKPD